jgi:hypothetical protein
MIQQGGEGSRAEVGPTPPLSLTDTGKSSNEVQHV